MKNDERSEVDPSIPTAAELRRDVLNRERPAPDDEACPVCEHGLYSMMGGGPCQRCGKPIVGALDDGAFADSDDGVLARHPFDLGGEA